MFLMMTSVMAVTALSAPALAFDQTHADFGAVLKAHVAPTGVTYEALAADRAGLDAYVKSLEAADVSGFSGAESMAFWINAYNALTLTLIVNEYPLGSIRDLDGGDPWNARSWTVAGKSVTLNNIEHDILRPMGDARIHAAVNCASRGCPPLASTPFTGVGLQQELAAASASWIQLNGARVDQSAGAVSLSAIFDWYGDDFVPSYGKLHDVPALDGKQEAAVNFAAAFLSEADRKWLEAGGYAVSYADYDWGLNAR